MQKSSLNPFQLILITVAVVVGGGLLVLGFLEKRTFSKSVSEYNALSKSLSNMEAMEEYPSPEAVENAKRALTLYKGKIEGVRASLKGSTIEGFQNTTPGEFASKLNAASETLKQKYGEKRVSLPEEWYLGFEKYASVPAPKEATGVLNYQLEALTWLHEELVKHNPISVTNIYRKETREEVGEKALKKAPLYTSLPIEFTFVADEVNAREFLNALANSNKYFYTLDTVKIKSVEVDAEGESEESTVKVEAKLNTLEQFLNDGGRDQNSIAEGDVDNKIFEQILGQEKVAVFLDLNLTYFPAELKLPKL